jgi:hypothetical protein
MISDSNFYDQPLKATNFTCKVIKFYEYCFIKLIEFKKPTKKGSIDAVIDSLVLLKLDLNYLVCERTLQEYSFLPQDPLATEIKATLDSLENSILEYKRVNQSTKTTSPDSSTSDHKKSKESLIPVPPPPPPPPMPPMMTTNPLKITPPKIELKNSIYTLKRTPSLSKTQLKSQKQSLRKISAKRSLSGTPMNTPVKQIVTGNDYFYQELQKKFKHYE